MMWPMFCLWMTYVAIRKVFALVVFSKLRRRSDLIFKTNSILALTTCFVHNLSLYLSVFNDLEFLRSLDPSFQAIPKFIFYGISDLYVILSRRHPSLLKIPTMTAVSNRSIVVASQGYDIGSPQQLVLNLVDQTSYPMHLVLNWMKKTLLRIPDRSSIVGCALFETAFCRSAFCLGDGASYRSSCWFALLKGVINFEDD
ncbi:hypothetical protein C8Q75DRAFT_215477 [Abortiporus biennis]|nr:hypothetical protein C8Q75DRAFT_215477 [Abortiporus biennis]